MNFTREINRLMLAMFVAFGVILLAATYYALVGSMTLLEREDNPRLVEAQQSILRGGIYDRNNNPLAQTTPDEDGFASRNYLHPPTYSALGYYSYRYGAGGAEAAFDDLLSGADLPLTFNQLVLRQPVEGQDIKITLSLNIQQDVASAMAGKQGAAVVMSVPNGNILAMVSLPTYDPNTLDENWDTLVASEGNPFFNRVLQGQYQPGTMMQMPIMVNAISRNQLLGDSFGASPVRLNDPELTLSCVTSPPQSSLTLRGAYTYGCPGPFAQVAPLLKPEQIEDAVETLQLNTPPTLIGFFSPDEETKQERFNLTRENLRKNVLGQGELSLSPIGINAITAAIINHGNTPPTKFLMATKLPNKANWTDINLHRSSIPYMTTQTAQAMQILMRNSAQEGTASGVSWGDLDVGGQAAVAYSGEGTLVWFTGFAMLEGEQDVVVTVVIENTDDVTEAVQVGQQALRTARFALGN